MKAAIYARKSITTIGFSAILLFSPFVTAQLCPKLTVSDAHVLTRKQLEDRICRYVKATQKMLDENKPDESYACLDAAVNTEGLFQERFGKKSPCWDDKPKKGSGK